ncbi:winged helix-turn-helix domain-containing protein [Ktedonobacter racemifer]|uniref:winged helix-turn-helix domain-containing protein n=1 Tax=Ktedonobacter racemifer TaxID=363277 RepID=UPI0006967AEC|nr:winged helix-turn-helix domain-containing protein [Ktedonobacter racemifer]
MLQTVRGIGYLSGREVWLNARLVEFSTRLFDLVLYFVQHQGIMLARRELLGHVQAGPSGTFHEPLTEQHDDRLLDVYVHWLREKIEEDVTHPQRIQTVRGIGYRFMG